jgi:hypothetical protein
MADIKFSCNKCGQHISCDEPWAGHQIQCPACQTNLTVPYTQPPTEAAAPGPQPRGPQPPSASRPKLSAGLTQVTRATPTSPILQRRHIVRAPRARNSLLGYAVMAVVLVGVGVAAYNYLPALLSHVQDVGSSKTSGSAAAPATGGGPMGDVNGAMDVSDALEGGSPSKSRASVAKPPSATLATNPPVKPATGTLRGPSGNGGR